MDPVLLTDWEQKDEYDGKTDQMEVVCFYKHNSSHVEISDLKTLKAFNLGQAI